MPSKSTQTQSTVISEHWRNWIRECASKGISSTEIYQTMRGVGFSPAQIRAGLNGKLPVIELDEYGRDASGRIFDYAEVSNCALTQIESPNVRRVATQKVQMYVWDDFLTAEECNSLIALSDTQLYESLIIGSKHTQNSNFRTSQTCPIDEIETPLVDQVCDRISAALGISTRWSEPTQAQKYEVGQEFKSHLDSFSPGDTRTADDLRLNGQRTWTFMVYLNNVESGGATRFRKLDKSFTPKAGRALIWNSLTPDGMSNPWTIHQGMKVRKGQKYVITKWFRDKGEGPMKR